MIEFFNVISGYIDKVTQFFSVILEQLKDAWSSINIFSRFFPNQLSAVIITVVVIVIVFRVLGR